MKEQGVNIKTRILVLEEINQEVSLEGILVKQALTFFGHAVVGWKMMYVRKGRGDEKTRQAPGGG